MYKNKKKSVALSGPIGNPLFFIAPGVLWLVLFGMFPLIFMFIMSFWSSTIFGTSPDFTFENFKRVIFTELYREQLIKTLRIAAITTIITLFISYPVAFLLSKMKGKKKGTFCTFNVSSFLD